MVSATSAAVESVEGLLTPRFLRIFTSTQQLPLNSFWFSRGVRSEGPVPSQSGARARHCHARRRPWLPRVEVPRPPPRPRPNQWCVRTPPARSRRPSAPTLNQTWHSPPSRGDGSPRAPSRPERDLGTPSPRGAFAVVSDDVASRRSLGSPRCPRLLIDFASRRVLGRRRPRVPLGKKEPRWWDVRARVACFPRLRPVSSAPADPVVASLLFLFSRRWTWRK